MNLTGYGIIRKVNHDTLWLKVTNLKHSAKISIGRRSIKVAYKGKEMKEVAKFINKIFTDYDNQGLSYGDNLIQVEKDLKALQIG